ncbi:MAG: hypothetical protein WBM08_15810 [Prochlorococcaceae cyanobacterium]
MDRPFRSDHKLRVSASVGEANYRLGRADFESLVRRADPSANCNVQAAPNNMSLDRLERFAGAGGRDRCSAP